ncbi:MAG: right-handed parallel beta-helix repeat-containing protein, partial [Candidatus Omnitrophica bacterium]|nr:right-handed parallel beta-helix repeat-containing protein [Candidatus Omnitrophota bacterium]
TKGSGVYALGVDGFLLANSIIRDNTATENGGGLLVQNCTDVEVATTEFIANAALTYDGGGANVYESDISMSNCTFDSNSSGVAGGGLLFAAAATETQTFTLHLSDTTFQYNSGPAWGGGLAFGIGNAAIIERCQFIGNKANGGNGVGGGFCGNQLSSTVETMVKNCVFAGNETTNHGGAFHFVEADDDVKVYNCTTEGNSAAGAAIYYATTSPVIMNCIAWNEDCSSEIGGTNGTPDVSYCCVRGGYTGTGNSPAEPEFILPWNGTDCDLQLWYGSPGIDSGTTITSVTDDYMGLSRPYPIAGTYDKGAFESRSCPIHVKPNGSDENNGSTWTLAIKSVTQAIELAVDGCEIWVASGTYNESIQVNKGVKIYGGFYGDENSLNDRDIDRFNVTIDASAPVDRSDSVFHLDHTGIILDGLTITGGDASPSGGGIFCLGKQFNFVFNCDIIGNQAQSDGGGVLLASGSSLFIYDSKIRQNKTNVSSGVGGGGICCSQSYISIYDSVIEDNTAAESGGGIYLLNSSTGDIVRCRLQNNETTLATDPESNVVGGGAVALANSASVSLNNCLIVKNFAKGTGGAIFTNGPSMSIYNSTISHNDADGYSAGINKNAGTNLTMYNSILYGNEGLDYNVSTNFNATNSCTDLSGTGNINQDPLFFIEGEDWTLQPQSPCINTGSDAYVNAVADKDLAGASRISPLKKEFTGISAAVDMGCYEWPDSHAFGMTSYPNFDFEARKF